MKGRGRGRWGGGGVDMCYVAHFTKGAEMPPLELPVQ